MEDINNQNTTVNKKGKSLNCNSPKLNSITSISSTSTNEDIYELVNSQTYVNINAWCIQKIILLFCKYYLISVILTIWLIHVGFCFLLLPFFADSFLYFQFIRLLSFRRRVFIIYIKKLRFACYCIYYDLWFQFRTW